MRSLTLYLVLYLADSGFIEQDITKSSSYYIAVGNVYLNEVKVIAEAAYDDICYNFELLSYTM